MDSLAKGHRVALNVAHELSQLPDHDSYLKGALGTLSTVFRCDDVFRISVDFAQDEACFRRLNEGRVASVTIPARDLADHPVIRSHLTGPNDLSPRRVSDCSTLQHWRSTESYNNVFARTKEQYQLSMVTSFTPPHFGSGWTITRSSSDFGASDVQLATFLLPTFVVLDRLYSASRDSHAPPAAVGTPVQAPTPPADLTPRELNILHLLAGGGTAEAIGRGIGISKRTVTKHLEHIYNKLDSHDRLLAVDRARRLGLLP